MHGRLHDVEPARPGKIFEVDLLILGEERTREKHAREKSKNRRHVKNLSARPHRRLLGENYKRIDVSFNSIFAQEDTLVEVSRQPQLNSPRARSYRYAQCCPGRSAEQRACRRRSTIYIYPATERIARMAIVGARRQAGLLSIEFLD
jgi:hypothetical protein